jgi:hypothetical protein
MPVRVRVRVCMRVLVRVHSCACREIPAPARPVCPPRSLACTPLPPACVCVTRGWRQAAARRRSPHGPTLPYAAPLAPPRSLRRRPPPDLAASLQAQLLSALAPALTPAGAAASVDQAFNITNRLTDRFTVTSDAAVGLGGLWEGGGGGGRTPVFLTLAVRCSAP